MLPQGHRDPRAAILIEVEADRSWHRGVPAVAGGKAGTGSRGGPRPPAAPGPVSAAGLAPGPGFLRPSPPTAVDYSPADASARHPAPSRLAPPRAGCRPARTAPAAGRTGARTGRSSGACTSPPRCTAPPPCDPLPRYRRTPVPPTHHDLAQRPLRQVIHDLSRPQTLRLIPASSSPTAFTLFEASASASSLAASALAARGGPGNSPPGEAAAVLLTVRRGTAGAPGRPGPPASAARRPPLPTALAAARPPPAAPGVPATPRRAARAVPPRRSALPSGAWPAVLRSAFGLPGTAEPPAPASGRARPGRRACMGS